LLINGVFRKLFLSSPAEFDQSTLQFRFFREFRQKIRIEGDNSYRALTRKAMERIGIGITEEVSEWVIILKEAGGKPLWILNDHQSDIAFYTLYDLVSYLKKHFLTK